MFGLRLATIRGSFAKIRRDKRLRRNSQRDIITEQVKKVLETEDQRLILMVRG